MNQPLERVSLATTLLQHSLIQVFLFALPDALLHEVCARDIVQPTGQPMLYSSYQGPPVMEAYPLQPGAYPVPYGVVPQPAMYGQPEPYGMMPQQQIYSSQPYGI